VQNVAMKKSHPRPREEATTPERDFQAQRGANAVPISVSVIFARGVVVAWHPRGFLEKPSNARV
jgi:hypothetical protein